MGKMQRDKGARFEREVVNAAKASGADAERVPLSGSMGGSFSHDTWIDGLKGECKIRANGFRQIYGWLEPVDVDYLALRADRREVLYVVPEELFFSLLSCRRESLKSRAGGPPKKVGPGANSGGGVPPLAESRASPWADDVEVDE